MLSTITIISIFAEIFTAGILLSGGFTFLKEGVRRRKDLFLGLVFLSLFVYVAAVLAVQLMVNLNQSLSDLIIAQKVVTVSTLAASFFIWLFIVERFKLKVGHIFSAALLAILGVFVYQVFASSTTLVYREGVIQPIVNYSAWIPLMPIFSLAWILLAVFGFRAAFTEQHSKLPLYSGCSAILFLAAVFSSYSYVRLGEAGYLLASWLIFLTAALGLLLSEIIPPESPEAEAPIRFLRTRLLFKLVLIFVLMVVILFEATALATINISKNSLTRFVQASYYETAKNLIAEVTDVPQPMKAEDLQKIVEKVKVGTRGVAFIVDDKGFLLAHPDRNRAYLRDNLGRNGAVARLLMKKEGRGEFYDELGNAMVGSYLLIPGTSSGLVIEESRDSAYSELRQLEANSLLFVIMGIVLAALTGIFFARSIERPIKELIKGTEAVAHGELGYHIPVTSSDELGRLAEAFNKMTKDLRDSQERLILSEKLASLGTMAAGMAHEIKNPLVSLRTFTQLLQQKWDDKEFRDKFSQIIPNEIERINKIAESLLKFGRPAKPELTKVEVNSLVDEVLLLFESEAKKYNVRVTKKFAALPQISGDAGQLSQVFVNIVKNGIEAMHEKGGELTVKTDVGEVIKLGKMHGRQGVRQGDVVVWGEEESMSKPLPVVFIEMTDTGEGISEENLKSLFDPFFTTKITGTGMGLPITLRIIEEHKGSIKVRSRVGKGTTFIITLPQQSSL